MKRSLGACGVITMALFSLFARVNGGEPVQGIRDPSFEEGGDAWVEFNTGGYNNYTDNNHPWEDDWKSRSGTSYGVIRTTLADSCEFEYGYLEQDLTVDQEIRSDSAKVLDVYIWWTSLGMPYRFGFDLISEKDTLTWYKGEDLPGTDTRKTIVIEKCPPRAEVWGDGEQWIDSVGYKWREQGLEGDVLVSLKLWSEAYNDGVWSLGQVTRWEDITLSYYELTGIDEEPAESGFTTCPDILTTGNARIGYNFNSPGFISLYSSAGRRIETWQVSGEGTVEVGDLSAGLYLIRYRTGNRTETRKLVVVR